MDLPCVINQAECGDFHSIKWYKENRRVYVYSPIANFAKAEGELVDRGNLIFDGNNETTRLQIQDLKTTDEGEYKCEITFLDITKDCPVVQLVKLTTLGKDWFLVSGIDTKNNFYFWPFGREQIVTTFCFFYKIDPIISPVIPQQKIQILMRCFVMSCMFVIDCKVLEKIMK